MNARATAHPAQSLALVALLGAGLALLPACRDRTTTVVVDDLEHAGPGNRVGGSWYYFNDSGSQGNSTVLDVATTPYRPKPIGFLPTAFEPALGAGRHRTGAATLAFEMGTKPPVCGESCTFGSYVGMGTSLDWDGDPVDWHEATRLRFWARASAAMVVRVEVLTAGVRNGNYHRAKVDVGRTWALHEIRLVPPSDLSQPEWTPEAERVAFDLTRVIGLQWQVSLDEPGTPTKGYLLVDDVEVEMATGRKSPEP